MQILNFSGKKNQMVSVLQAGHPFKYILVEHAGRWMTVDGVMPMDGKPLASCVTHLFRGNPSDGSTHDFFGKIEIITLGLVMGYGPYCMATNFRTYLITKKNCFGFDAKLVDLCKF